MNTRKICPQCFRESNYYKHIKGKLHKFCSYCGVDILKYQLAKRAKSIRKHKVSRITHLRRTQVLGVLSPMPIVLALMCIPFFTFSEPLVYKASAHEITIGEVTPSPDSLLSLKTPPRTHAEAPKTPSCEEIDPVKAKVECYASKYGVKSSDLLGIIQCESSFNPNARNVSSKEASYGLAQINTLAHDVSVKEATDADFAIEFLAKHWSEGKYHMWKNCSRKLGVL